MKKDENGGKILENLICRTLSLSLILSQGILSHFQSSVKELEDPFNYEDAVLLQTTTTAAADYNNV